MSPKDLYARRREELLSRMEQGVAVIPSAVEQRRNGDVELPFRQDSDFHYLSGFREPDSVAVLRKAKEGPHFVLFVRPRHKEREIWTGRRAGPEGAVALFGADEAYPIDQLGEKLPGYLKNAEALYYRLGDSASFDERMISLLRELRGKGRQGIQAPAKIVDPGLLLHELRLFKRPDEIELLRRAAQVTGEAHVACMREARAGMKEYELQAILDFHFRKAGGDSGYAPIVASGENTTILHYSENSDTLEQGELVLIDAGAELELYTADVTRTFPVRGRFSGPRRDLYQLVLDSQLAGIAAVKPGATIEKVHRVTLEVLVKGLLKLGLLSGELEPLIEKEDYKRFYMHRTSHWLGMDVHDVGAYQRQGQPRPLEPGMVLTVEPGLYFDAEASDIPAPYRGIGIRIEDDVLVTPQGCEVLTASIPKQIADIERLTA